MTMHTLAVILVSALCTFAMRALPFALVRKDSAVPQWLTKLGEALPAAIMAVLVIYCLKDIPSQSAVQTIPQLLGVMIVVLTYHWRHNTLLSIVLGTAGYMLMIHLL